MVLDTSKNTVAQNMFSSCTSLTELPKLDFSNASSAYATFSWCIKLHTIEELVLGNSATTFTSTFNRCDALQNIIITGAIYNDISFKDSKLLTHESLMSIINALYDYKDSGKTYTVTLGTENLAKLTDAEKAIATQKGWTLA